MLFDLEIKFGTAEGGKVCMSSTATYTSRSPARIIVLVLIAQPNSKACALTTAVLIEKVQ